MGSHGYRRIPLQVQRRALRELQEKRFPARGFGAPDVRGVFAILRRSDARIRKKLGPKYVGLVLTGSRSKGTAVKGSDIDYKIICDGFTPADYKAARDIIYEEANFGGNPFGKAARLIAKNKPFSLLVSKHRTFPFKYLERYFTHGKALRHIDAGRIGEYMRNRRFEELADLFGPTVGNRDRIREIRLQLRRELSLLPEAERKELVDGIAKAYGENRLTPSPDGLLRFSGPLFHEAISAMQERRKKFALEL